ncbi:MAG: MATE family efflux transporter, partial [Acetivibrio ethanolgignens]
MKYSLERPITAASLLRFSLPTIISMIFMGIYTTIDGVFVSQLIGTDALSSVNIIMPVANAAIAVGTMFGTGGNAIVAKRLGEGREQTARENFSLILITAAIVGLIFTVAGLIFINPLVFFLGSDQSLYTYCYDYALYTLLFVPACVFAMIFQVFFITAGHAGLGLSFSIAGGLSNIVLDYVLIHMYSWGIKGAAVATGISYTIPSLAGFAYFACKKNQIHICRPKFHWNVIQKACLNGASEMVTNLSMSVVTLLFNLIMMEFAGSDGVASVTIILYSQYLMSCVYLGYAVGIAPIISYNYGRRDTNRLKKLFRLSLIIITIASIMTFTT